jgi:hypothetical protein
MRSKPISLVQGNALMTPIGINITYITKGEGLGITLSLYSIGKKGETLLRECNLIDNIPGRQNNLFLIQYDPSAKEDNMVGVRYELSFGTTALTPMVCKILSMKLIFDTEQVDLISERSA